MKPTIVFAAVLLLPVALAAAAQPTPPARRADGAPATADPADRKPEARPAAAKDEPTLPWPLIEQVRRGNRIGEVRVTTPRGEPRFYLENREGRTPLSTQDLSAGLSTQNFFRLEF
jgi:hypothetical protein